MSLRAGAPGWPGALADLAHAPRELWLRGREEILELPWRVAIVGTRSPTPYGDAQARRFAAFLAERGVVVVSGMARGIDQAAHEGSLSVGGATIAVLGSGVSRPWPAGPLADRIVNEGLLLSEYAPTQGPRRHHFPLRNRLISALSSAVLVVEAAHASGSLITARWAVEQGREVYALPGRVDHPMARGCHRLLREGARLVEAPEELLLDMGWSTRSWEATETADTATATSRPKRSPVFEALRGETLSGEELALRTRQPLDRTLAELVELELAGGVARCPGGLWRLLR